MRNTSSAGRRIALSPDGHIIALGMSYNQSGYEVFALCRYSASGILDTTFGTSGNDIVYTSFGSANSDPWGLAIEPDGRIVTGGRYAGGTGGGDFALARFTINGAPDPSFGNAGLITTDFNGGDDYLYGIAISPDSSIVAAGYSISNGIAAFALARYGERLYVQQDANWNVTSLTDQNGNVKERFVYDPYGSRIVLSPSWGTTTDAYGFIYGFQDGRTDPVTGNVKFGIRDYRPSLQRWLQEDVGYLDSANLYEALRSNPPGGVDPTGLEEFVEYQGPFIRSDGRNRAILYLLKLTWGDPERFYQPTDDECRRHPGAGPQADPQLKSVERLDIPLNYVWGQRAAPAAILARIAKDPHGEDAANVAAALASLTQREAMDTARAEYASFTMSSLLQEAGMGMIGAAIQVGIAQGEPLEMHHLLPRQFRPNFEAAGLDIDAEEFLLPIPKSLHRLKPGGIHCGPFDESWNGQWAAFFAKNKGAKRPEILAHLAKMRKQFGI